MIRLTYTGRVTRLESQRETSSTSSPTLQGSCSDQFTSGMGSLVQHDRLSLMLFSNTFRFIRSDPASGKVYSKMDNVGLSHAEWITEQRHRAFGKCYSILVDEKIRKEQRLAIS